MADDDVLAERFEANRSHLRAVAYRMLGSMSEADDAVQEAWLRVDHRDAPLLVVINQSRRAPLRAPDARAAIRWKRTATGERG